MEERSATGMERPKIGSQTRVELSKEQSTGETCEIKSLRAELILHVFIRILQRHYR